MALKPLVKVGNVTNLSDARYCAGMGVDFLGFQVIEGQRGAISAKSFQEIRGWVTGPQIVAEIYGISGPDAIPSIIENFQPDYFELSVDDYKAAGSALTLPYILQIRHGEELPSFLNSRPAYILTDNNLPSVSRLLPDNELLVHVRSAGELPEVLSHTGVSGVCLSGGTETRPGLKSYDELAEILEALEID